MIEIFGKKTCKECDKLKSYLDNMEVPYTYYDLAKSENREERKIYRNSGWTNLPVLRIGEYILEGFDKQILMELFDV